MASHCWNLVHRSGVIRRMRYALVVGYAVLSLAGQLATACEKQSVHLSAAQMANRIVKRAPIAVQAHAARISGSIELLVEVDTDGKPSCISVVRGHPILTSAAVVSVKDWRFRPYRSAGKLTTYSGSLVIYAKDFADGYPQQ
jgi:TonB family protein